MCDDGFVDEPRGDRPVARAAGRDCGSDYCGTDFGSGRGAVDGHDYATGVSMLAHNLLYTAVTRGQTARCHCGAAEGVAHRDRTQGSKRRWTKLREWLSTPRSDPLQPWDRGGQ